MSVGKGNGAGSKKGQFKLATNCSRCSVALTLENKRNGRCVKCYKAAALERVRKYNAAHPDRYKASQKKIDLARKDDPKRKADRLKRSKAWALANPERTNFTHAIREARRRARKRENGGNVTLQEWETQLEVFGHACAYCLKTGVPLEMEHVWPIARGGRHDIENVVPSCGPCNYRKHARGPLATLNFRKAA